jgi:hypothetical protein
MLAERGRDHAAAGIASRLGVCKRRRDLQGGSRLGAGYVAIDPIPRIGDPPADVGFSASCDPPATTILQRAEAVAEHMGPDRQRALRRAAVWVIPQTCPAW